MNATTSTIPQAAVTVNGAYTPTAAQRSVMQANPEIGTLLGGRGLLFYAYIGGYEDSNYVESYDVNAVAGKLHPVEATKPARKETKTFKVEVRTQFDVAYARTRQWSFYASYYATSKADAIRQARSQNFTHGSFDGRTFGLIWWRATEE